MFASFSIDFLGKIFVIYYFEFFFLLFFFLSYFPRDSLKEDFKHITTDF